MSAAALRAGLGEEWPFEIVPRVPRRGRGPRQPAINVGAMIGHTPVRLYVMGEESTERAATADEVAQMRAIVAEAIEAGAVGLRHLEVAHPRRLRGPPGAEPLGRARRDPGPRRRAGRRRAGRDPGHDGLGPALRRVRRDRRETGRPISWTALLAGHGRGPGWPRGCSSESVEPARRRPPDPPAGELPAAQLRVHHGRAVPLREHAAVRARSRRRPTSPPRSAIYRDPEFRTALREKLREPARAARSAAAGSARSCRGTRPTRRSTSATWPSWPTSAASIPPTWCSTSPSSPVSRPASAWRC